MLEDDEGRAGGVAGREIVVLERYGKRPGYAYPRRCPKKTTNEHYTPNQVNEAAFIVLGVFIVLALCAIFAGPVM